MLGIGFELLTILPILMHRFLRFINTTELYNTIEVTYVSLPQLIIDGSSSRRRVSMVKFLTPIYVYFYCFEIFDKK